MKNWRAHMDSQAKEYARINVMHHQLPRYFHPYLEEAFKYAFKEGRKSKEVKKL